MPGARVSQHVVEVLTPLTPASPYVPTANQVYSSSDLVKIVTGLTETIVPGCDLTATGSPASVVIGWDLWISQYSPTHSKQATLRIRRTNVAGAVLASTVIGDSGDSQAGHQAEWTSYYLDAAPTDYHYVLTVQETLGFSTAEIWTNSRLLDLNPTVTGIVSQDVLEVLGSFPSQAKVSQCVIEVLMADADTQTTPPAPPGGGGMASFGYVS